MITLKNKVVSDVLNNVSNKEKKCYENRELFEQWSYCCKNQENQFALDMSAYETAQAIQSISKYVKDKTCTSNSKYIYSPRQIIMVDLGLSAKNLCYMHPCVVMSDLKSKVFVIPCTSGPAPRITKDDGSEEIRNGYMEGDASNGFEHLTTLILKEAKCIDKSQIVYVIKDSLKNKRKIDASFFKKVYDELFKVLMEPKFKYIKDKEQELVDANQKIDDLTKNLELITKELESIKNKLKENEEYLEAAIENEDDKV